MNKLFTPLLLLVLLASVTICAQERSTNTLSPLLPPFLREGDRPQLGFSLRNNSTLDFTGTASFSLLDENNQPVDGWFFNSVANQYFTVDPAGNSTIIFPVEVPFGFQHKTNWKLLLQTESDTISLLGNIPVYTWDYEDISKAAAMVSPGISVQKQSWQVPTGKAPASRQLLDEYATIQKGDMVAIQLTLWIKQPVSVLKIEDGWAAGLESKGEAKLVQSNSNSQKPAATARLLSNDNEEKTGKEITIRNVSPGTYVIEYWATAMYPGTYNQPPSLLFINGAPKVSARSAFSKINIE